MMRKAIRLLAAALLVAVGVGAFAQESLSEADKELFHAARFGTASDVKAAVKNGGNVNARMNSGYTMLMYAVGVNPDAGAIKELIAAGADVNARADNGFTALMFAAGKSRSAAVVKALAAAGADMNAGNEYGTNALMIAAYQSMSPEVVKALVDSGASVNARDKSGRKATDYLAARNDSFFYATDTYRQIRDLLF